MRGIVQREENEPLRKQAKQQGLACLTSNDWALPFERTLFIQQPVNVPWDMLGAGFDFLDKWECAAPVWRYDITAADLAKGEDRKRTEAVLRDLRVPLYAHELLFVKECAGGLALLETWQAEREAVPGGDARLAFLRALYLVKPFFLALPRSWLAEAQVRKTRDGVKTYLRTPGAIPLVRVEVAKGRFVRCRPGDEEKVKREFQERMKPRHERRMAK